MTGLIYVILIAVWGVVLVPRWLRRHDEKRQMGDSGALEAALSNDSEYGQDKSSDPGVDEFEEGDTQTARAATWGEYLSGLVQVDYGQYLRQFKSSEGRVTSTARRRRRILVVLAVVSAVSLVGVVAGFLPGSLVVLSTFLLGGYLSAMVIFMRRGEARPEADLDHQHRASARDSARDQGVSGMAVDGVRVVGSESNQWDPRETTLPTYVTKSKASKIPRRIDLTSGWTGAEMVAQAREQQQASPELEQQFNREWAVVEPEVEDDFARYANGQSDDHGYYRRAVNE